LIKVFPDDVKEDVAVEVKKENEKDPNSKAKKEEDEDPRSIPTKMNLIKNKLRAMGLKMSHEPEGEMVDEGIEDVIARLEKKRISKGGDPKESPLPAMRKYHGSKKKKVKKGDWIGPPPKKQETKEGYVQEADSLAAQTARWEANRQRRMKKSGSYERPNWIPRDQDHEDRYGSSKGEKKKPQKTHANLQNEATVQSALDSLNTYYAKNEKLHGSLIHNEDAALDFVKKKIEKEVGKGGYVSKDNPMKPQSAADKAKARAHQAKVDAENAAARAKDPSQGRYPKG